MSNGHQSLNDKKLAEECLQIYLLACESALSQAKGDVLVGPSVNRTSSVLGDGNSIEEAEQRARKTWVLLQRAKMFVINPAQYIRAHYAADWYTTETLAQLSWDAKDVDINPSKLMKVYEDIGPFVPFPDKLPFDSIFLAYGKRLMLNEMQLYSRIRGETIQQFQIKNGWLYGHVIGTIDKQPFGAVVIGLEGAFLKEKERAIALITIYDADEWYQPLSLDPWIVPGLIHIINEHKKLVIEHPVTLGMKLDHKSQSKKFSSLSRIGKVILPLPKPYYSVVLHDDVIDQTIKHTVSTSHSVQYSHRFDVRGHECVRVMKGKLPLDSKFEFKLKKKKYKVYTSQNPVTEEDGNKLIKRGVTFPANDEWLAILSSWKNSYVKGNKDLPYVPAIRKIKD